ncbi:SpoIID/LytB domain-containing protein [Bdellovibrio sp. SKB1291214]|uniref:SpoIID/LytB domain-containing protein n=1 Tax=Bdellovibrio sp. SKB1291214 TaxID=1732569 RepID=UPI0020CF9A09|nr:SpoIID/LytB domain-containing protein [Bdellovibrio sp. SKB1291214]UYL07740.1 SpoIID/LytB domain-containing protein [Bdellovibrio sp. SKB1291214]
MRIFWALVCFLAAMTLTITDAQAQISPQTSEVSPSLVPTAAKVAPSYDKELVRVRIATLSKRVQVAGLGLRFQILSQPYRHVAIPEMGPGTAEVRVMKKNGKNIWALRLKGRDSEHLFKEKYLMIQGENLRVGAQSLPSRILLSAGSGNQVDVVGVLPLDEYIAGVISSEMPINWPIETLKAQAVAARSYALSVMEERSDKPYHLESSVLDQVFRHIADGDESDPKLQKALKAVRDTAGIKLFSAKGHDVLKAYYHADCGGHTTLAKNVWSGGVNSGVAVDSSCPTNPKANWTVKLTRAEIAEKLQMSDVTKITLDRANNETRVRGVRVALNETEQRYISANEFRQALGFSELRSTLFEMKQQGDEFTFTGRGFGHGVGLCQWGSRAMGLKGQNFVQILKHYYPAARIARN